MYWLMSSQISDAILLLVLITAISVGGWLIASHAFRLRSRERLLTGIALGIVVFVFFSNVLGRWIEPGLSFWLAGGLVLAAGGMVWSINRGRVFNLRDLDTWPLILLLIVVVLIITLIGRGVSIFDDRKNLSIISTMAAGDIPPHFYMNPEYIFNYHYGFQLFGAALMRVGGLFPWSAFDLSKGIVSALAIILAGLWGWRATYSKIWAAVTTLLVTFASGSRWALNFLPQSLLRSASDQIELWGASGSTVNSLYEGLSQTWAIDGGPPLELPFSYINGILQPFILKLHKGPISLSLVILFLMLLLVDRHKGWKGVSILSILFATWALVAEAEFILFGLGMIIVAILTAVKDGIRTVIRSGKHSHSLLALLAGGIVSIFQGGTITEMAKGVVGLRASSSLGGGSGLGAFHIRWPPAIVSAHLGELRITNSYELLVGIIEIGPAILAGILVGIFVRRWIRNKRIPEAALALGSIIGILLPLILRYDVDRDMTRLSAFALMGWILFVIPTLSILLRRVRSEWLRIAVISWLAVLLFGGFVVTGSLITSIPKATFSYHISDLDVHMTRIVWDELPEDALVMSAHEWRVVPVTGRLTRTSADNTTVLDSWLKHVDASSASGLAEAGFDFVYIDEAWWGKMSPEIRSSFSQECAFLLAEVEDTSQTHFRKLIDVSKCVD